MRGSVRLRSPAQRSSASFLESRKHRINPERHSCLANRRPQYISEMVRYHCLIILVSFVLSAVETPATGVFTTTFQERHPSSFLAVLGKRYGWAIKNPDQEVYDLSKESFEVNVPSDYNDKLAYGLLVYTNASKGGNARQYDALLGKNHLLWIGAENVPNERAVAARWGLALDAAWNMAKRYHIDPRRVYAVGISGGGRCSSRIAPTWPETFTGGIYLVGCNPPILPADKTLAAKALNGRYALVTGSDDFNRKDTQSVLNSYKSHKFLHVEYFEQPGLGHASPNNEWFAKALAFVDAPLVEQAKDLLTQAVALEARKPYDAAKLYLSVINDYPVAFESGSTAQAHLTTLTPAVEAGLTTEMDKLGVGSKDKWRAMSERTLGFVAHARALSTANAFGETELGLLITAGNPGKIAKFRDEWSNYPCAQTASETYEKMAATALQPITALEPTKRPKAVAKFLKDWQDCPSRVAANTLMETDLDAELTVLLALPKNREVKVLSFAKAWPGTAAAAKAITAITPPDPTAAAKSDDKE